MLSASRATREPRSGLRPSPRGPYALGMVGVGLAVALLCAPSSIARRVSNPPAKTAAAARAFVEFQIPTLTSRPSAIAVGPGGNLWFTEERANKIGRITPSGKLTTFTDPTPHDAPTGITAGPDGNVWFTGAGSIGRITPAGSITHFPIPPTEVVLPPPAPPLTGSSPYAITTGPDGNLWFTEWLADKIGRITPSGTITQFQIPTADSDPYGITVGPDGNLWFTEERGDKIGRITPSGTISEFQVPIPGSFPYGITAGREGNLWFTETSANDIGRITPSGAISEFKIPTVHSDPSYGITATRDGNVWFTEEVGNKIGRITPSGAISEFAVPAAESSPVGLTASANGDLWFTEALGNSIGRIEPQLLAIKCVVPRLTGKTLTQAKQLLARAHCSLGRVAQPAKHSHKLVVVSQNPAAKRTLASGTKVNLRLG